MKAAIDIDGTLAAWPKVLAPLSHALTNDGWDVVLLTGSLSADPASADREELEAARYEQVESFKAAFESIVVCVGKTAEDVARLKAEYCLDHGIDLLIDDCAGYCHAVCRISPETLVLQVQVV